MLRVAAWCGSPDPTEKVSERIRLQREQEARAHPFPRKGELPIPQYPFDIDEQAAAQGKALYAEHCASCHDWQGNEIGQVTHIVYVGTDPKRLESFTEDLVANQNTLGAGQWWRFRHFRKTHGYANMPLDGIWARAPYLHNGSVPTLRDLLNNPADRPQEFYRGDDEYDPHNVGFRSDRAVAADGRKLFKFNTRLPGNHNGGHQYGTELSPQEKNDLLEYLKTIGRKENST
jgi:cytochrome c peroxidase